jgi:hypothetical protein
LALPRGRRPTPIVRRVYFSKDTSQLKPVKPAKGQMSTLIKNGRIVTAVDDYQANILIDGKSS